ncbi:hypothetical protein M8494_34440 (plasmid) [Serratia ureilytica]
MAIYTGHFSQVILGAGLAQPVIRLHHPPVRAFIDLAQERWTISII